MEESKEFSEFWQIYPRKVSKGQARRTFKAQLRKGHKADDILNGVKFFCDLVRSRGTDRSFIPHPSTWLNGERWTDDELHPFDFRGMAKPVDSEHPGIGGADIPPRYARLAPYAQGCTFDGQKIIAPTEARKAMILNRFQHLVENLQIEVRKDG